MARPRQELQARGEPRRRPPGYARRSCSGDLASRRPVIDLAAEIQSGASVPSTGMPATFQVTVNRYTVKYRAFFVQGSGAYEIPTYFIP